MGRPSLANTRSLEILEAFERCVSRFGLEGSTLERIAEEAGMKRSILRHYVGNRHELVEALTKHVLSKHRSYLEELLASIPLNAEGLAMSLLPAQTQWTGESVLVIESLIAASEQYDVVRQEMSAYVDDVVVMIADYLKRSYPSKSKSACWNVAYGIVCIWFNQESLGPLELPPKYVKAARAMLKRLVESLED